MFFLKSCDQTLYTKILVCFTASSAHSPEYYNPKPSILADQICHAFIDITIIIIIINTILIIIVIIVVVIIIIIIAIMTIVVIVAVVVVVTW
ncbi:hypothetical protein ElyMa_005698600 [Elysia marginata]|uniref:Uncharacterized protein n=1 Tax=Elysia marginata TaxID=1093978 RepID=A0AAV4FH14_9GAST|nr:hypothetical protein ElyMa_005698600 [Elysia marginata]